MAEFPPNLDDGELWLPSNFFLGEVTSNYHNPRGIEAPDDLAQHLAAFSPFQPRAKSPPVPHFQRFRPPVQYGSVDPVLASELYRAGSGFNVGRQGMVYRNRAAPLYGRSNLVKPTQPQVESFLEARARVFQRQQNRLHSRLMPVQGRIGAGMGGFARESGGTGVFLPRVVNTSTANIDFGKKQGPKNTREIQVAQQRHPMKRQGVNKLEDHCCQFSPSPEIILPQDWTY